MVAPETRRLLEAVRRGGAACSAAEVRDLLRDGADANAADGAGRPALLLAVASRCGAAVAEALLAGGADPNAADKGRATPLLVAAQRASVGDVRLLLDAGADPNAADRSLVTPLHTAVRRKGEDAAAVVALLLERGAAVDSATRLEGATALHFAVQERGTRAVELLLAHGADPNATNSGGQTPLELVRRRAHAMGVSLDSAAAMIMDMLLGSGRLRIDRLGYAAANRLLGLASHRGPDALKLFGGAGLVVRSAVQLADATRAAGLSSRPAAAVRVLLGMVPAAHRAALASEMWSKGARSQGLLEVLFTPGVLAVFLAAGARFAEQPGVLKVAVLNGADEPGYTAAAVAQLLRAGARGVDDALLALAGDAARTRDRDSGLLLTLRVLLAHGADPERVYIAGPGRFTSAMERLVDIKRGGKYPDVVRDAVAPRAEAVRASMLRATGDRDATRLALAFFSSFAPLSVPLGELATDGQLQAALRAQRNARPMVRARRRRRQLS